MQICMYVHCTYTNKHNKILIQRYNMKLDSNLFET